MESHWGEQSWRPWPSSQSEERFHKILRGPLPKSPRDPHRPALLEEGRSKSVGEYAVSTVASSGRICGNEKCSCSPVSAEPVNEFKHSVIFRRFAGFRTMEDKVVEKLLAGTGPFSPLKLGGGVRLRVGDDTRVSRPDGRGPDMVTPLVRPSELVASVLASRPPGKVEEFRATVIKGRVPGDDFFLREHYNSSGCLHVSERPGDSLSRYSRRAKPPPPAPDNNCADEREEKKRRGGRRGKQGGPTTLEK